MKSLLLTIMMYAMHKYFSCVNFWSDCTMWNVQRCGKPMLPLILPQDCRKVVFFDSWLQWAFMQYMWEILVNWLWALVNLTSHFYSSVLQALYVNNTSLTTHWEWAEDSTTQSVSISSRNEDQLSGQMICSSLSHLRHSIHHTFYSAFTECYLLNFL